MNKDAIELGIMSIYALASVVLGYALARDGGLRQAPGAGWMQRLKWLALGLGVPLVMWGLFGLQLRKVLSGATPGAADPVKLVIHALQAAAFAVLAIYLWIARRWSVRGNPLTAPGRAAWRRESVLRALLRDLADEPDAGENGATLDAFVDYAELEWLEEIAAHLAAQAPPRRLLLAIDETDIESRAPDDPEDSVALPRHAGPTP